MAFFGGLILLSISSASFYKAFKETAPARAVSNTYEIESDLDLANSDGEYITFTGTVQANEYTNCVIATDEDGNPAKAVVYSRLDERWIEVNDNNDTDFLRQLVSKRVWTPQTIVLKDIKKNHAFKVVNKSGASVVPVDIENRYGEFPLLSTREDWQAPETLNYKGELITRVYEAGTHSVEEYLSVGTGVTIVGSIKNKSGIHYIKKRKNTPYYILTSLPKEELLEDLNSHGTAYLAGGTTTLAIALATMYFVGRN